LQYGLEKRAAQYPHLRAREQQLLSAIVAPFDVFLLDHDVVEVYGRVRAALENSGTAIGALDAFIAAQALSLGAVLVTSNEKEFQRDRKSTRLNSSHVKISYAVFCLKKKKTKRKNTIPRK